MANKKNKHYLKKKLAIYIFFDYCPFCWNERDLAQPGRALALGARCRRFESSSPDQIENRPKGRFFV